MLIIVSTRFCILIALCVLLLRGTAGADVISGSVELFHQTGDSTTKDATGLTSESTSENILQRYHLRYSDMLSPFLNLRVGMRVDRQDSEQETDGVKAETTSTTLMPSAGLTLRNPFVFTGVEFDRREDQVETAGGKFTTIRESRNAFLGLKPEGLPSLDLYAVQRELYDKERVATDLETTTFSLFSVYRPVRSLEVSYRASWDDGEDHLRDRETKGLTQNGRVSYRDQFFDNRASLYTSFNRTEQDIRTSRSIAGGAVSSIQLFPVAGLSSINDTPLLGALDPNPALIDGNLTAGSGINIGQQPSQGGDTRRRNVAVDFGIPTDVSALFVWVDRELPSAIANSYNWEVYTSQDNLNWVLHATISPAAFGPFDNRFELNFAVVRTRYIKAVTRPLSVAVIPPPGVDVNNIFITELQAFIVRTLAPSEGQTTTETRSNYFDLNGKLYLLRHERYALYYDLYIKTSDFERNDAPPSETETLINALSLNGRLSKVWTGSAKILRKGDTLTGITGTERSRYNQYTASLMAAVDSLRKLSHNLALTANREEWDESVNNDRKRDSGTAYLTNYAEIYPGINASLGLGKNLVHETTVLGDIRTDSSQMSITADIVPHRTFLLNGAYSWTAAEQKGSGSTATALGTTARRSTGSSVSVTYNPLTTLYLFGSISRTEETGQPTRTSTYLSGSWTLRATGGALELRLIYMEDQQTELDTRNRQYGPYARWRINVRMYFEATYLISTSESPSQRTDSETVSTALRMFF